MNTLYEKLCYSLQHGFSNCDEPGCEFNQKQVKVLKAILLPKGRALTYDFDKYDIMIDKMLECIP